MQIKFILYNLNTWFTQSKQNLFDRQILQCGYLELSKFAFHGERMCKNTNSEGIE